MASHSPSRRWIYCGGIVVIGLILLYSARAYSNVQHRPTWLSPPSSAPCDCENEGSASKEDRLKEPSQVLVGPATERFEDNLRNDVYYITAWANAGFTNQLISYINLIYLGTISERIPVIPPFVPDHHISMAAGVIPFGEIFNLTYLRAHLHTPIVEWFELKQLHSTSAKDAYTNAEVEPLGCWSTRNTNEPDPIWADNVVHRLGVDVAYTRVPDFTRRHPGEGSDTEVVFDKLAATIYPRRPFRAPSSYPLMKPSKLGTELPPNERMSCYDILFTATSGVEGLEWHYAWSPAWRVAGRNLRFTQPLVDLATEYLRKIFQKTSSEPLPPFIAVHMRRGDFYYQCTKDGSVECYVPIAKFADGVDAVRAEISKAHHIDVQHVFVSSDEETPQFWSKVSHYGWAHINHTEHRTTQRFGEWYPALVDMVSQSLAVGFVGTKDSTFSLVSSRRVEDWNNGATRIVGLHD